MAKRWLEKNFPILAAAPVDFNDGATTGDYICMKGWGGCAILIAYGDGTADSDLQYTIQQATDVANSLTDAKALNCLETGRIFTMDAATYAAYALLAATHFNADTQATADEVWLDATNGEAVGICVLEVFESDLDTSNGFDCLRCDVTDPGAAKIGAILYILHDPKDATYPTLMRNPLID